MNIILWLVFGGLAGWIASIIVGQDARLGLVGNIVVGIVGAFIGGWIFNSFSGGPESARPSSLRSFIVAVIGSVILLLLANLVF